MLIEHGTEARPRFEAAANPFERDTTGAELLATGHYSSPPLVDQLKPPHAASLTLRYREHHVK